MKKGEEKLGWKFVGREKKEKRKKKSLPENGRQVLAPWGKKVACAFIFTLVLDSG